MWDTLYILLPYIHSSDTGLHVHTTRLFCHVTKVSRIGGGGGGGSGCNGCCGWLVRRRAMAATFSGVPGNVACPWASAGIDVSRCLFGDDVLMAAGRRCGGNVVAGWRAAKILLSSVPWCNGIGCHSGFMTSQRIIRIGLDSDKLSLLKSIKSRGL